MKYAILKVINGNFFVHAEGIANLASAKANYHGLCQTLWNAEDVISGYVKLVNEHLEVEPGYEEYIHHSEPENEGE